MFVCSADGEYKKRAKQKYYETCMNKWVELYHIDHSRRSMYKDLQKDYERNLSWARSLGIGTQSIVKSCPDGCETCEGVW